MIEKGRGQKNQNPTGAACDVQTVQDESGFDGFAKAHLVREEDARIHAGGDIGRDGNLVRDEVHAPAREASNRALAHLTAALKALHAQLEALELIDLAGQETLLGFRKSDIVGKLRLSDIPRPAAVGQQAAGIRYGIHMKVLARVRADGIALLECDAADWCAAERVLTVFASGREKNLGAAEFALQDDAETKLGFGIADPPLTGDGSGLAHNAESSSQRA